MYRQKNAALKQVSPVQPSKLRMSLLGEQTAENDGKLLISNFVETPEYRSILETKDSTVVVGRRGTGKSAMFSKLRDFWSSQKSTNVIAIAPEDFQTIRFRAAFRPLDGKYSYVRSVSRLIWKYGLIMEMLACLAKHFKARKLFTPQYVAQEHLKTWNAQADYFGKLSDRLGSCLKGQDELELAIGSLSQALSIAVLEAELRELMSQTTVHFYILIDRLDEGYENDETGAAIISGAISAVAEINKHHEHIRPVLFQRDNILRSVERFDPDYSRNIEGEILTIHWDTHQLQSLVTRRLNTAFSFNLEKAQRIWDRCTADEGPGRELQGLEGFKKCLQFTLYRPRDLLSLLNQAFFSAGKDARSTIVLADVESTAKAISATRLGDLKKEYSSAIPSLPAAVSMFEHGSPELSYQDALSLLDGMPTAIAVAASNAAVEQDYAILKSDGVLKALYSVGFVGTHDETSNSFTFCHDGRQAQREFVPADRILVHPCYWIALNLTRDALAPAEAEQINDEYEIKVTSSSPAQRAQRIGALIAELGTIDTGHGQHNDFEQWAVTAVQAVFAGHLGNVELKANGQGVQRRDIIGTNLARSAAWGRIEKDYSVRQVVFEVKNYAGVGRDEYRQMSTYLTGAYGRLGFLITRDEEETLRAGPELDWVREIYTTQQKLIIKLSQKFFQRVLGKLRKPDNYDFVDTALATVLDQYERRYLNLESTRPARSKGRRR